MSNKYFIGETFDLGSRLFYLCVAVFWSVPLWVFDSFPFEAKVVVVLLEVAFLPMFIFWAVVRRVVSIDIDSEDVVVATGVFYPYLVRRYPLSKYNRLYVHERELDDVVGEDSFAIRNDGGKLSKIEFDYFLSGERGKLKLIEICCSSSDIERLHEIAVFTDELQGVLNECGVTEICLD